MVDSQISTYGTCVAKILRGRIAFTSISQSLLAQVVEVSQSQLSKILKGTRSMSLDVFVGLCAALGLEITDVINEANDMMARLSSEPYIPAARMQVADINGALQEPENLEWDAEDFAYFVKPSPEEIQEMQEWRETIAQWKSTNTPSTLHNPGSHSLLGEKLFGHQDQHKSSQTSAPAAKPDQFTPSSMTEEEKRDYVLAKMTRSDVSLAAYDDTNKNVEKEYYADAGA